MTTGAPLNQHLARNVEHLVHGAQGRLNAASHTLRGVEDGLQSRQGHRLVRSRQHT